VLVNYSAIKLHGAQPVPKDKKKSKSHAGETRDGMPVSQKITDLKSDLTEWAAT
jgi:hypothetical protein